MIEFITLGLEIFIKVHYYCTLILLVINVMPPGTLTVKVTMLKDSVNCVKGKHKNDILPNISNGYFVASVNKIMSEIPLNSMSVDDFFNTFYNKSI